MKRLITLNSLLLAFISLASLMYFIGLPKVPFHPDEATYIYMSDDFSTLFKNPSQMIWRSGAEIDLRMHYRLIDAPLTRYLVGIFRSAFKSEPLKSDWNWGLSWEQNVQNGAMPTQEQLLISRFSTAIFFPFCLLLIFLLGRKLGGLAAGWVSLIVFAGNALILLHTRRAMAEGPVVFFILLSLWFILRFPNQVWWSAFPLALAFNAKYSPAPLVLVGVVAILTSTRQRKWYEVLEELGLFALIFLLITFLLNPFLWADPIGAVLTGLSQRQELVSGQVSAITAVRPDLALPHWWDRLQVQAVQLFFAPLAIQDVGNYTRELQGASTSYLSNPIHTLLRGIPGGAALLFLSMVGLGRNLLLSIRYNPARRSQILFLSAAAAQWLGLILLVPLPFQRYIMPLVPFVCGWIGLGVAGLAPVIRSLWRKQKPAA